MSKVELTVKYIADAVIEVKKERFGEDFVSIDELIIIKKLIELRFKKMGYDANFGDVIFNSHFRVDNGVVAKTNLLTWEKEIEDEQVREIVYNKEFIYYCLCQILINKLNNSMEHNCKNCETECTGLFRQSHSKPNDCIRWAHDFAKDCINNISLEERILLEEEQNQQMPFPVVPDSDGFSFIGDDNCVYQIRASLDPNKLLLFRKDGKKLSSDERIPQGFLQTGISIAVMERSKSDEFFGDYEMSNSLTEDSQYLVTELKVKSYESDLEEDKTEEKGIKRFVKRIFNKKKK